MPPCNVANPEKFTELPLFVYVGDPSSPQVAATFRPVSAPPLPVMVSTLKNPPLTPASVPSAPFASTADSVTASIWSPCSVSLPPSPSTLPVSAASMSNVSASAPPFRSKTDAAVTLNWSASVPPCKVAKPEKFTDWPPLVYVGEPSRPQVAAAFRPVSAPLFPVMASIFENPPLTPASVPSAPSAFTAVSTTASIWSPCSVSLPPSPSIAPVSAESMSNVSAPAPPFRLKAEAAVTLNWSASVPPCSVAKPEIPTEFPPAVYVGEPSKPHVLAVFNPVNVPLLPLMDSMFENPPLTLASVPSAPSAFTAVTVSASIWSPCSVSLPPSPSIAPVTAASTSKVSLPAPPNRLLKSVNDADTPPVIVPSFWLVTVIVSADAVAVSESLVPSPVYDSKPLITLV